MMRASLACSTLAALGTLLATVALAPDARAQPQQPPVEPPPAMVEVTPPAGWALDAARTAVQARTLRDGAHLGGAFRATDAFYRTDGGALIVSELIAAPAPADVGAAARAELTSIRSVVEAAGGTLVGWRFLGGEPTLPEAALEWTDPSVGTTSISRTLVFRTADALAVVTGECVLAGDAGALRGPCEAALAALRPLPALKRLEVGLGATDPLTAATAPSAADAPPPTPGASAGSSTAPTMSERPGEIPTTILVRPPSTPKDNRPLMLLVGVGVLAAVFLWNRRQRGKLDEAEARERRRSERSGKKAKAAEADAEAESDGEADADADADAEDEDEPDEDGSGDRKPGKGGKEDA